MVYCISWEWNCQDLRNDQMAGFGENPHHPSAMKYAAGLD